MQSWYWLNYQHYGRSIRVGIILRKYITPKDCIKIDMYINHLSLFMQSNYLQLQLVSRFIHQSDINHTAVLIIITRMVVRPQETLE